LFVAHGLVVAGIDLQNLSENDVWFEGKTLFLRLPSPGVFIATLDNDKSYVYDREKGILTKGDPNLDKKVQITLPIMSFEMMDMSYDASRKLNTNQRLTHAGGTENTTLAVYNSVPFNFDFELYAYVRNIEDGAQLMEKILPYFTPDYTLAVNLGTYSPSRQ
jgi:hypothetical protein